MPLKSPSGEDAMTFPSQQLLLTETGKEQRSSERGKTSRSLSGEVKEMLSSTRVRSWSDPSAGPTWMSPYLHGILQPLFLRDDATLCSTYSLSALYRHSPKSPSHIKIPVLPAALLHTQQMCIHFLPFTCITSVLNERQWGKEKQSSVWEEIC